MRAEWDKTSEFVWTPVRVKLFYVQIGKAIQESISKNDKMESM